MAKKGERFLRNMIDVGRGITGAYVEGLIAEEKRAEEEKKLARQEQIDSLDKRYKEAQITKMGMEKPPEKPSGFNLNPGQERYEPDGQGGWTKVASVPPEPEKGEKPSQADRDLAEYQKLTKKPPVKPIENIPTMAEPEGGYKMSPTGAITPEQAQQQEKIKILRHRLGLEDDQSLSPVDRQKLRLSIAKEFFGNKADPKDPKSEIIDETMAIKIADDFLNALDPVAEPDVNQGQEAEEVPEQQYQPAKSFHGAKTYEAAISGIDISVKNKIFTPEQAEILKQQAKAYFGVQ